MDTTFVDADGHILEPGDLWDNNLEPQYRDRSMHFEKDANDLEQWVIDGKVNTFLSKGTSANMATMGKDQQWRRENIYERPSVSWEEGRAMNPGAGDPHERIKVMDSEGIDKSILYPSLGLDWPGSVDDPQLLAAYCRVYNDWITDFCRPYPSRLFPALLLPWTDVSEIVKELKRTATIGPRAVMVPGLPFGDIAYGREHWDPVWAELQDQDLPPALHVSSGGTSIGGLMYPELETPQWWGFASGSHNIQIAFMTFFQGAVFDRFPELKLVVLESGCMWMPFVLERMDEKFEILGFTTRMKHKPSEYFEKQGWIAMDPDDEFATTVIGFLGADKLVWAYDYPHSDSPLAPVASLIENLKDLPEDDQRKVMGRNAIDLYKLS